VVVNIYHYHRKFERASRCLGSAPFCTGRLFQ